MAQLLCPVVVGRDDELQALEHAIGGVAVGRGGCVVLSGEPGIGKSRLALEAAARAAARDLVVVGGRAVPSSVSSPYHPITHALLQLVRRYGLPSDADMAMWMPSLASVLPGVIGGPVGPAEVHRVVPSTVRGEAVLRLLRRLAPSGVVLVLEDLHWADPDSVALVEYLADNVHTEPVLCLVTLRTEPMSGALDMVQRQRGRPGVVHLELARLDDDAAAAMIAACAADSAAEHVAWVRRTAEGVPLMIEDLLASRGLPATIAASVRERLAELPTDQRSVIESAAVIGRHFDWELLPAASARAPEVVAEALAAGVERLLVAVDGDEFHFRHALTREAVLAAMLPTRQRSAAAAALAAFDAAHPVLDHDRRDIAAELAVRAGDRHRAGMLLLGSGGASLTVGALATAVETLRRAADLLEDDPRRTEAELLLIEALSAAGRVDEAAALGNLVAGRLDAAGAEPPTRVELHLRVAQAAVAATRWRLARHWLESAARIEGERSPAVAARQRLLAAEVALAEDDPTTARRLGEGVLTSPDAAADVRCHAFEIVGRSHRLRDLDAARVAFEEALTTAERAQLPLWRLRALHELGTIDMFDHAGFERLGEARRTAEAMGAFSIVAPLDLQLSACFTSRWELDRCDAHARAALALAERLGIEQVRAKALSMLTGSASMRADIAATDEYAARTLAADSDDEMLRGFCLGSQGVALLLHGEVEAALDPYRRGIAVLGRLPNAEPAALRALWPLLLASIADRRAGAAIDEARRLGVTAFRLNRSLIAYGEAILAGRRGERHRADEIATAAAAGFVNCDVFAALARFLAAPSARADGWGQPDRWLTEAVRAFDRSGLDRLAGRAEQLLKSVGANPWADQGITDREADVLRLVAKGLANKEIAVELGVSPRTVEKHVESLLRKRGVRTRVELAVDARPTTT